MTVSAGTVIRCVGNFVNNGEIVVMECTGAYNESIGAPTGSDVSQVSSQSHPGDAGSAATAGWYDNEGDTDPSNTWGGVGGRRISKGRLLSFNNVRIGGGSGAGFGEGACGGGLLKIYCKGSITNEGIILANGTTYADEVFFYGNGGGAGGIVILASMTSIKNSGGGIQANGGVGSSSFVDTTNNQYSHGPGGGGGGGIIILAAPSINSELGDIFVFGGPGGPTPPEAATGYNRYGGGGGGGCGGNGGRGGHIDKDGGVYVDPALNGGDGQILILTINPLNRVF